MRRSKLVRDADGWKTLSSERNFANSHVDVVTEEVQTPSRRQPCKWTTVRRKAAVVIAPITSDGKFLLIKEERIPIRATIWSMPAGQIENETEPDEKEIQAVALRELHEETGHDLAPNGQIIPLGYFFTSPGLTDEHCYFFVARPVQLANMHKREEGEAILECRAFTGAEVGRMIAENEIRDSNTLGICARMSAQGFLSLHPAD